MKSAWLPSEKWFLILSSLVTLGFGALGVGLSRDTRPQVVVPPHAPLPVPNGLDLYASAAFYSAVKPPVDPLADWKFNTLSPSQKRARYSLARRNAWEKGAAPAWTLFEQAKAAQSLAPRGSGVRIGRLTTLEFDKVARANTLAMQGDWNGALQNDVDDVEMEHDLLRGAGLERFSYTAASLTVGIQNVEFTDIGIGDKGQILYQDIVPHLSASEARAGAQRMERLLQTLPRLSEMAREQKAADQELWLATWGQPTPGQSSFEALFHSPAGDFDEYGHAMDKFIAIADQPLDLTGTMRDLPYPLNSTHSYSFDPRSCLLNYAWLRAQEEQLMLRLALRAYRLEHGAPPAKLSDLTPATLKSIPLDPFDKGPRWHYKNGAAWSIGPDCADDGGQPIRSTPPTSNSIYGGYSGAPGGHGDIVARG